MRGRDSACDILAVSSAPRPPQPFGRVEACGILALDPLRALDAEAAQYCVDETLMRQQPALMREIDARCDRGVRRGA